MAGLIFRESEPTRRRTGGIATGCRRPQQGDGEAAAERAENAAEPVIGGDQRRDLGIGEEMPKLGGADGGFGHGAEQPGDAARQGRRLPIRAGAARDAT